MDRLEKQMGIHFATNQRDAIKTCAKGEGHAPDRRTRGPEKTTTTVGMLHLFDLLERRVLLAAPTGRAAKRMSETTGREAKTIHRLLEFSLQDYGFKRNQDNPLEADVIIIDGDVDGRFDTDE